MLQETAAAAILDFQNFNFFNGWTAQDGRTASPFQIWSKSRELMRRYGDIFIFQGGGRRRLGFSKFQFLTVGRLKRIELHRRHRLDRNWSNCCGDMVIFRFSKTAASAILDLLYR